tara:strand:+ start:878 stop:1396 length:519 start_codon:yes stop_codon:yes gene_type:complete
MKTGIEKFKNVINSETCDLLINYLENNLDDAVDLTHSYGQNVLGKEIILQQRTELNDLVHKSIKQVVSLYADKYDRFRETGVLPLQLRKITGNTKEHIDNLGVDRRNVSIILGLNSDYEKGQFHFPYQDFSTTLKRGEAIVFPVYFMYPHFVDAPIGNRYTINTWLTNIILN